MNVRSVAAAAKKAALVMALYASENEMMKVTYPDFYPL